MLLIDSDKYAALGIETMWFPGGEPHIKVPKFEEEEVLCFLKLRTWSDTTFAVLLLDALRRQDINVRAFIPYFPAARQDREQEGRSALTLALTTGMFNLTEAWVGVFDPHSDKTMQLLRYPCRIMPSDLEIQARPEVAGIIAPDKGALSRALSFRDKFYPGTDLVVCDKLRNPQSGALIGYSMPSLSKAGKYIIVDDICDGGGTFNLLANAFVNDPLGWTSSLEMFVSHGIFSKGIDAIHPKISHITTTDSWCQLPSDERLTVLPLNQLFPHIA